MKNLLFLLLFSGLFLACEQEQIGSSIDRQLENAVSVSSNDLAGDWEVSLYRDDDDDKTSDFASYTFTFEENGSIKVFKDGSLLTSGKYELSYDNRVIDFEFDGDDGPLDEMDEDWVILTQTANELRLREFDDDDDDDDDDLLNFRRI